MSADLEDSYYPIYFMFEKIRGNAVEVVNLRTLDL
jgi:hypothetical protein